MKLGAAGASFWAVGMLLLLEASAARQAGGTPEDLLGEIAELKAESGRMSDRIQTLWTNANARLQSGETEIKRLATDNGQLTFQLQSAQGQIAKDKTYIKQLESRIGDVVGHLEDAAQASQAYAGDLAASSKASAAALASTASRHGRLKGSSPPKSP